MTSTLNQKQSRHQLQGLEVTTSLAVATSDAKERRSRRHSVVVTSVTRKGGRDIIQWSRHQLPGKEVATSFSCRDKSCKERRSRHHLAVATLVQRDLGSRHHLAVSTSVQRDLGSRHHLAVVTSDTQKEGRDFIQ